MTCNPKLDKQSAWKETTSKRHAEHNTVSKLGPFFWAHEPAPALQHSAITGTKARVSYKMSMRESKRRGKYFQPKKRVSQQDNFLGLRKG